MSSTLRKSQLRRRQQVRRNLAIMLGFAVIAAGGAAGFYIHNNSAAPETAEITSAAPAERKLNKTKIKKQETGKERINRVRMMAQAKGYPANVIELLDKNTETVQFVEDYGEKKDQPAEESIGANLVAGQIPLLLQWDERWGYAKYGTSIVAVSGCGPTCLSMVVSGLKQDASVTPAEVASYSMENGLIDMENNTLWKLMQEGSLNWGVNVKEVSSEESMIQAELTAGHPVICSVGPGDFTKIGHFIVLTGYEDGSVTVNDPFSIKNSSRTWVYRDIKDQIAAAWAYSLP